MMDQVPDRRRTLVTLVIAVVLALLIAVGASYAVVVSQNPAASVSGPPTSYGPGTTSP
jgi:hypothetical protein